MRRRAEKATTGHKRERVGSGAGVLVKGRDPRTVRMRLREAAAPACEGQDSGREGTGGGRWPTRSGMEHLERCEWFLRGTLVRATVRRYLPWALVTSMLAGSFLKEFSPLPESYLSNKRNVLNV